MTAPAVQQEPQPAPVDQEGSADSHLAGRESLAVVGACVVLALLSPGVGGADALLRILW